MKRIFLPTNMVRTCSLTPAYLALSICSYAQTTVPPVITQLKKLRTNIYAVNTSTNLLDATLVQFSSDGNNGVDRNDAMKIASIVAGTHLGMLRDGKNLIIERRQSVIVKDTIFYNLMTASKRNYRFEFIADNPDADAISGFLTDSYLGTSIPVNLNSTTSVDFTVNADAASSATDRFQLVFETKISAPPLPFTFNNVTAQQGNNDVAIQWITENQQNIKSYYVETSVNGFRFVKTATVTGNRNDSIQNYQWLDVNASQYIHYYRICSINNNDEVSVSDIVKVVMNRNNSKIIVSPIPVIKEKINLKFNNQAIANYGVEAATVIADRNNSIENYQWPEANAGKNTHRYGIGSIKPADEVLVNNMMKVAINTDKSKIIVYPNPVANGRINLKFTNQPTGNYAVKVVDNFGRVIVRKQIHLSTNNVIELIEAGKNTVDGVYHLQIISPDNKLTSINLILQ